MLATLAGVVCVVQVVPSGEVRTVPSSPDASHWVGLKATERRLLDVPEVAPDQVMPSAELMITPSSATQTKPWPSKAVPRSVFGVPVVSATHEDWALAGSENSPPMAASKMQATDF